MSKGLNVDGLENMRVQVEEKVMGFILSMLSLK